MEYAWLTQYDQRKRDGTTVGDWFLIRIGKSDAQTWDDRELWDSDRPDRREGKFLYAFSTTAWANPSAKPLLSERLWMRASVNGKSRRSEIEAWLRAHGYRPIEELLEEAVAGANP